MFEAMQKGLIDQETGLALLEAQVITAGLVVPKTKEKLSLIEGLARGVIDCRTHQLLQEVEGALQLLQRTNPSKKQFLPAVSAMEDATISESLGLKILEVQLATGGVVDTGSQERIGLEEALQRGIITTHLHETLASHLRSCKNLIDPNSAKKMSLKDLLQLCIFHQEAGLSLLPVKQLAGGIVSLKSGQKVSVFRAVQEGLIEKQVTVRLLEAQLFAGGIVDPKSGHRLAVGEAIRHGLIDQDLACALFVRQLQTGGIIDTITGERLSLDEAVRRGLVPSRVAVVILESLWSLMGLLRPESGEILPVSDALEQGILTSELAHKILINRQSVKALFIPETREILPWQNAVDFGILDRCVVKKLKSTCLPDVMPDMPLADSPTRHSRSILSSESKMDHEAQGQLLLQSCDEKVMFYMMTHSYVNIHNGQKLLLVDGELSSLAEMLVPAQDHVSNTQPLEMSRNHAQGEGALEDWETTTTKAKPSKKLAVKELEFNLSASEEELEKDLPSSICPPKERVEIEMKDAEKDEYVKKQVRECVPVADLMSEVVDSGREQGLMVFQSRHEVELPVCKSMKDSSFEIKPRDVEVTRDDERFAELPAEEKIIFKGQETTSKAGRDDVEKEIGTLRGDLEKVEESPHFKEVVMEKLDFVVVDGHAETTNGLNVTKVENGSVEGLCDEAEWKTLDEHINERQLGVDEGDVFQQTDGSASPKQSAVLGEVTTLKMLLSQLQKGGIIHEQTGKKMLLDESIACGIVSSHTAIKLMEEAKTFGGFFDAETCEPLTTEEVIGEGLMDEKLLQKVLASDQAISGVVDPRSKTIYSIKDAAGVGLLDKDTAERILEGQVVTGGIVDLKRAKKVSVTLASNLGLVQPASQEELKKLEKVSKGKSTEAGTKEELFSLQAEIGGILDPKTKEQFTVTQAAEKGFLTREKAFQLLTKQIADGGILHHKTGMRLSVEDAMEHGLIDHVFYADLKLAENTLLHRFIHPETKEHVSLPQAVSLGLVSSDFVSKFQGIQASTGSIIHPVSGQKKTLAKAVQEGLLPESIMEKATTSSEMKHAIINPESCRLVPYSELVGKSKIDIESGQRYLEVVPFQEVKDEVTGDVLSYREAVKLGKVDLLPSLRLLQAQADTGGIMETSTGQRLTLASALELEEVDEDTAKVIAVNQLLTGGIVDVESGGRVTLEEATEKGLVSQKLASAIQGNAQRTIDRPGLDDLVMCKSAQAELMLQNGTSQMETLVIYNYLAGSNCEHQRVLSEAVDHSISKDATSVARKELQEVTEEIDESPSLPSVLDSLASQLLGEGSLIPELSLMLDPDAARVKTQEKNFRRKSKLRGKELWKGELAKPERNNQVIEKTVEGIVSREEKAMIGGLLSEMISGGQEQAERTFTIDNGAQEKTDTTSLDLEVAQGDISTDALEMLASKTCSSIDHKEEGKVCADSKEASTVGESVQQFADEIPFGDTQSELQSPETELRAPIHSALQTDLKTSTTTTKKKKKKKNNKKQGVIQTEPDVLHEPVQATAPCPISGSKETLLKKIKGELVSGVQEHVQDNTSGKVTMKLAMQDPAEMNKEDKKAFGKAKKQPGLQKSITGDQEVNIVPKIDASRGIAEQKMRTRQASLNMADCLQERISQAKAEEQFVSDQQLPKVTPVDVADSVRSPDPKKEPLEQDKKNRTSYSFAQSLIEGSGVEEAEAESRSSHAEGLSVTIEETQQTGSKGGKIIGPKAQSLRESAFLESKKDSSGVLPVQQNAVLEVPRKAKNAGEPPCSVEGEDERWQDAPKQAKVSSFF